MTPKELSLLAVHRDEVEVELRECLHEFWRATADLRESDDFLKALQSLMCGDDLHDAALRIRKAVTPLLDAYAQQEAQRRMTRHPALWASDQINAHFEPLLRAARGIPSKDKETA